MNSNQYIQEIVRRSCLPPSERKRLKSDLESEIGAALERGESIEQIMGRMGEADRVAAEIYENFSDESGRPFREYQSERRLFGLPLVHIIWPKNVARVSSMRMVGARTINIGGRYGYGSSFLGLPAARGVFAFGPKAKGIVAIGFFSAGILSLGFLSAGILSIGLLSAGLVSMGNIALGLLIALGNLAAGALAAGNLALGFGAAANMAIGKYAIGNEAAGAFTFFISDLSAQLDQIRLFFAGLDAPAPIRMFFQAVERVFEALVNPAATVAFTLGLTALLLVAIMLVCIACNRLLRQKNELR